MTLFADPNIHPKYEEALERVKEEYLGKSYPIHIGEREIRTGE